MKREKILAFFLAVCLMLPLAACANAEDGPVPQAAVFYNTRAGEYRARVRDALDTALESAGFTCLKYETASQLIQDYQIDDAITQGCRVLIVDPIDTDDPSVRATLKKASSAGIGIIFINQNVSTELLSGYDLACRVTSDGEPLEITQGRSIGEYLLVHFQETDLNGDGIISYVLLQDDAKDDTARLSVRKAEQILADSGLAALEFYDASNESEFLTGGEETAAQAGESAMNAVLEQYSAENHNMVECVFAANDELALGAAVALQEAGYNCEDGIRICLFGIGGSDAALAAVDAGAMTGTVYLDGETAAAVICRMALDILEDGTPPEDRFVTVSNGVYTQP